MKSLELTLSAPIASFGTSPRMQHRFTQSEPTHSAIIGLIACAMGLGRDDDFSELRPIKLNIKSVTHGEPFIDFQTVQNAVTVDGNPGRNFITYRHALPDYLAIVEISGEENLIDRIKAALQRPVWQLYLGRRSNVLSAPVVSFL